MLPHPAPTDFKAASILAKVCTHWASKSSTPTTLPSRSTPTWPAMKTNSEAFTRVRCEYCPSGLPSASGLRILMSATFDSCPYALRQLQRRMLLDLHAAGLDRLFPLLDFAPDEITEPLRAAFVRPCNCCPERRQSLLHRRC